MKNVKITVMRKAAYDDLSAKYEKPIEHACDMIVGQTFVTRGDLMPEGFCPSAWTSLYPFVLALSCGGRDVYDGWMKDEYSAMISCNDGFRPVSFLLEAINEEQ